MRRTATRLTTKSASLTKSALVGGAALAVGMIAPPACATASAFPPVPTSTLRSPSPSLAATGAADLVALALLAAALLAAAFFLTLGVLLLDRDDD